MEMRKRQTIGIIINSLVFILGSIAIILQIAMNVKSDNGVNANGANAFRFFTNDGNILCIIIALISLIFNIRYLINEKRVPRWIYSLNLISIVTGAIIFLVVIFVLIPTMGFGLLKGYSMIILHAVNPILIVFGFYLSVEKISGDAIFKRLIGGIGVILYGIVALILVISKVWEESEIPYPFLEVYKNPVWESILYFVAILGGSLFLSFIFDKTKKSQ